MEEYLIWSEEHGAWWAPDERGYTTSMRKAGRYPFHTADIICKQANFGGQFHEVMIPVPVGLPS